MPSTCSGPSGSRTTIRPTSLRARCANVPIGMMMSHLARPPSETAELLLAAARYLNETLDPERVYDRFHELLEDAVPHAGGVGSAFHPPTQLVTCEDAWVGGEEHGPASVPARAPQPG